MDGPSPMVELRGITKRFPGVLACDHVDLQVYSGEIHALLGENGAGKSTLMKILYGQYQPDADEIWIDGRRMVMRSTKVAIRLTEVSAKNDGGLPALRHVSLTVQRGEIVGVAGVAGNGQRELAEVIVGLRRATAGPVRLGGEDVTNAPPEAIIRRGVGYIPEDRHGTGLVASASILDNLLLKVYRTPPLARGPFLHYKQAARQARRLITEFAVQVSRLDTPVGVLLGGTQQRVLLARELSRHPPVLVACSPTRGLDVRAVATIHRLLLELRQRGGAILLISEDLDELIALADHIAVIFAGEIAGWVQAQEVDASRLGLMMSGGGARVTGSIRAENRA